MSNETNTQNTAPSLPKYLDVIGKFYSQEQIQMLEDGTGRMPEIVQAFQNLMSAPVEELRKFHNVEEGVLSIPMAGETTRGERMVILKAIREGFFDAVEIEQDASGRWCIVVALPEPRI